MSKKIIWAGVLAALAVALGSAGSAQAQDKPKTAEEKRAEVHRRGRIIPIRGNSGFHYGGGYDRYTMHMKKAPAKK